MLISSDSMGMLRSSNRLMKVVIVAVTVTVMLRPSNGLMNTLTAERDNKYDFTMKNDGEDVKLKMKVVIMTITWMSYSREWCAPKGANKKKKGPKEDYDADSLASNSSDGVDSRDVTDQKGSSDGRLSSSAVMAL
ncbi:hypothetical protein L6452_14842 [Arctium lappa]|uniref:Uncharacterized protein n=1 Tax=Arctium lappa TaxID=4217 RepID=A0ACB9CM51_ARCLA|nr:hypothetical protein L6452_14842 [Arctium lappa]